jgi:hypothetical protein
VIKPIVGGLVIFRYSECIGIMLINCVAICSSMMADMISIVIVIMNSMSIAFMGVGYACLGLISPLEWVFIQFPHIMCTD